MRNPRSRFILYNKRKDSGLCPKCGGKRTSKTNLFCRPCLKYIYSKTDREQQYKNARSFRKKLRLLTLAAYGDKCVCCGETTKEFLTIDHVNNNGAEHRKKIGTSTLLMYMWLRDNKYPGGFQILCRNCNWGKHINAGACPHLAIESDAASLVGGCYAQ